MLSDTYIRTPVVNGYLLERPGPGRLSLAELRGIQDEQPGLFVVDGEYQALELTARRALTAGLELSATLPVVSLSGGIGADLGRWVDEALGIHLNGHERLARDSFVVYFRRPDGEEVYVLQAPGQGLGDLRLALQGRLPIGRPGWKATLGAVAELPTGDPRRLHGSGSFDYGLQLAWAKEIGRRRLLGHLGATRLGRHTFLETPPSTALSGSLAYQLPLGRRWQVTWRWYTSESVIQDDSMLNISRPSSYIELELVRRNAEGASWHVALSDNLPFHEVPFSSSGGSADFTLQVGARWMMDRNASRVRRHGSRDR